MKNCCENKDSLLTVLFNLISISLISSDLLIKLPPWAIQKVKIKTTIRKRNFHTFSLSWNQHICMDCILQFKNKEHTLSDIKSTCSFLRAPDPNNTLFSVPGCILLVGDGDWGLGETSLCRKLPRTRTGDVGNPGNTGSGAWESIWKWTGFIDTLEKDKDAQLNLNRTNYT